jgi:outer membrane receptor for ferrienterochelin and colicins
MRSVSLCGRFVGISVLALLASDSASAQQASGVQTSDELIVYGTVVTRNRTDTVAPTLSYDLEYFQRFEPISAGDALKRVPGVSFSSDVLEYDQVQLRGLPSTYSQVQVNGQNQTGGGNDRVFFVDRIPAELIDGIEIIRSPSADMSSEGIGGTVNAKLKRAGQIQGGWVRGSGFGVEDDELRGAGSVGYGNTAGDTSYLISADVQQRRNPKTKEARIFDTDDILEGIETQEDTRDGTDYAVNGEVATKVGDGLFRLTGFLVITDRTEEEFTQVFEIDGGPPELDEVATQLEDINQHNFNIVGDYTVPLGSGELLILGGYNRFVEDTKNTENEGDTADELELNEIETIDTTDEDVFGTLAYTARFSDMLTVKFGTDGRIKTREFEQTVLNGDLEDETPPNGVFDIEERRIDPYVKATWNFLPGVSVETGLRYEHTNRELSGPDLQGNTDFDELNPSVHMRYALTDTTLLRFSVARTVLRPSFDQLTPATIEDEPIDDKATIGNPNLAQETAWGIDAGFDQKLGDRGIFGFNFFNRDIKEKIELIGTGLTVPGCDGGTCDVLTFQNVGDARAYGIEVDLDVPLTALGLPETSIFANYTWLRSEFTDPLTGEEIRFRDQPRYIYNVGLIQNMPSINSTFGVSYQKRGESITHDFDEIERLTYEGNLEAFWETRLSKSTVIRFSGANLLNAEKVENKQKFDADRTEDEDGREVETEESGRLFLMTVRQAF